MSELEDALGPADLYAAAREAAIRRVEEHERFRGELSTQLRQARELQAVTANRRDEAAARARRLSSHLGDCDALLERAGELTNDAEDAHRELDERRTDRDNARAKLRMVEEQRAAAERMIENAAAQLHDLETSELDETTLRREVEKANNDLRAIDAARAEAADALRSIEQAAASRGATRDHMLHVRADLVARVESPLIDTEMVRVALDALDAETVTGEPDLVAHDLARQWIEVNAELDRIEDALPPPPSAHELAAAEEQLTQLDLTIQHLEDAGQGPSVPASGRDEIEAAHDAVLAAEEDLDHADDYEGALERLHQAREAEHHLLSHYGYESYLDVILSAPQTDGDHHPDLMDALRAQRIAEDTYAAMQAAAEPPAILTTLWSRRDRIYQEAANLLGCDPGDNVAELLYAHPVAPPNRIHDLASALAAMGLVPVGMSVRETALTWLLDQDHELADRDEWRREIDQLDHELDALDDEDVRAAEQAEQIIAMAHGAEDEMVQAEHRLHTLEEEMADRAAQDERRLQRIAAAEQLRAQIAAVSEAIERSDEEYHSEVEATEMAVITAEANLERSTAALSDAVRRLRRIAEGLPPALRPRSGDDPLGELPRLRETLSGEVERAEAALATATTELAAARSAIDDTQAALDDHLTIVPADDITDDDVIVAVGDLVGTGPSPAILDDPFVDADHLHPSLLEKLVDAAERCPVVLMTDDPETLGWAISLPSDLGTVTRLPTSPDAPRIPDEELTAPEPAS